MHQNEISKCQLEKLRDLKNVPIAVRLYARKTTGGAHKLNNSNTYQVNMLNRCNFKNKI